MAEIVWNPRLSCPVCSSRSRVEIDKRIMFSAYPRKRAISLAPVLGVKESVMNKHLEHIGGDITGPEDYGQRLLQSLEVALQDARDIIQDARGDGSYSAAINGIKAIAMLIETQAKLVGLANSSKQKSVTVSLSLPEGEVAKLAKDYENTVEIDGK